MWFINVLQPSAEKPRTKPGRYRRIGPPFNKFSAEIPACCVRRRCSNRIYLHKSLTTLIGHDRNYYDRSQREPVRQRMATGCRITELPSTCVIIEHPQCDPAAATGRVRKIKILTSAKCGAKCASDFSHGNHPIRGKTKLISIFRRFTFAVQLSRSSPLPCNKNNNIRYDLIFFFAICILYIDIYIRMRYNIGHLKTSNITV